MTHSVVMRHGRRDTFPGLLSGTPGRSRRCSSSLCWQFTPCAGAITAHRKLLEDFQIESDILKEAFVVAVAFTVGVRLNAVVADKAVLAVSDQVTLIVGIAAIFFAQYPVFRRSQAAINRSKAAL